LEESKFQLLKFAVLNSYVVTVAHPKIKQKTEKRILFIYSY